MHDIELRTRCPDLTVAASRFPQLNFVQWTVNRNPQARNRGKLTLEQAIHGRMSKNVIDDDAVAGPHDRTHGRMDTNADVDELRHHIVLALQGQQREEGVNR
jgi:hypothetical protein